MTDLTPFQAARFLNVGSQFVLDRLVDGTLPSLRLDHVLTYRDQLREQAEQAAQDMTAEAEELGLYDD